MSLYILTSLGVIPFGNLIAGAVAERFGAPLALAGGGTATLADPHRGGDQLPVAAARSPGADRRACLKPFGAVAVSME